MKKFRWLLFLLFIPLEQILRMIAKGNPDFIENVYSKVIYIWLMKGLSIVTGFIPFSVGETLLIVLVLWLIYLLISSIVISVKEKDIREMIPFARWVTITFSFLYLFYFLLLGANYYRQPVEDIGNYNFQAINAEELAEIYDYYIEKANAAAKNITEEPLYYSDMFDLAYSGYANLPDEYAYMKGFFCRPKTMLFSDIQVKMGYSGMFFFYTGEALVNSRLPLLSQPYVISHEMAHQRAIAREGEANYISILACINNDNEYFRYAGYVQGVRIIGNELYKIDKEIYQSMSKKIDDRIIEDLREVQEFWRSQVDEKLSKEMDKVVEKNLKINDQNLGLKSYNEVAKYLIIDYYERY